MKIVLSENIKENIKNIPYWLWFICCGVTCYSGIFLLADYVLNGEVQSNWLLTAFLITLIPSLIPFLYIWFLSIPETIKTWRKNHYKNGVLTL